MLLVSFLRKSFFLAGGLAGWLADWLCGTNSLDLMYKCILGRLKLKTRIFFLRNQYNKTTFTRDQTLYHSLNITSIK